MNCLPGVETHLIKSVICLCAKVWNLLSAGIAGLATEMGATDRLYPKGSTNMFASLARNIAGQQLATAAAFKIHGRFVEACKVFALFAHGRQKGIITYVMLQPTAAKISI